jgi:4,5-DOPA dioxygenase extradiol
MSPGTSGPALHTWAKALDAQPAAIVICSPHWMTRGIEVMAKPLPETWHDFGGFPRELYALQYPAPGAPQLAARCAELLQQAGLPSELNTQQNRDHGAWVPTLHAWPEADIPVIQVSMPADHRPEVMCAIGRALAALREERVLLVGSGSMTHNLREFMMNPQPQNAPHESYASDFARWVESKVLAADVDALLNFQQAAPSAERAHPSIEHFVPLHFAIGAAGAFAADDVHWISREVMHGRLAMDSFAIG